MKNKKLMVLGLTSALLAGCTLGGDKPNKVVVPDDVSNEVQSAAPTLTSDFLWESMGEDKFVEFMAKYRCFAYEGEGHSEDQTALIEQAGLTTDEFDLAINRPDWVTEYAAANLEQKIQAKQVELCTSSTETESDDDVSA